MRLPTSLFTTEDVRAMDRTAIQDYGVDSYLLMTRAAQASLRAIRDRFVTVDALAVVCGSGNNAGDGYVLARIAQNQGLRVTVFSVTEPSTLSGDAARAWKDAQSAGVLIEAINADAGAALYESFDLIVDALLGSGLTRPLQGLYASVVSGINASDKPVASLDLPSGLNGNTGLAQGMAVMADLTITFVALKIGLFTGEAKRYCGFIVFDGLGIPAQVRQQFTSAATRIGAEFVSRSLPPREADSHKTQHGRVLVVGGGWGMPGATILAGSAALRAGAGLVKVACHPNNVSTVVANRPELMCHAIEDDSDLNELLDWCDVVAIGPGLGRDAWAKQVFDVTATSTKPKVIDADALFYLAAAGALHGVHIVTPHVGEAATLLHSTAKHIQEQRIAACRDIATRYQCVTILKGAGTVVCDHESTIYLCDKGNPGMATAGTGDVLTGIVAALFAQGLRAKVVSAQSTTGEKHKDKQPSDHEVALRAAVSGAWVHACAGDQAAVSGQRGLVASDLLSQIRMFVN